MYPCNARAAQNNEPRSAQRIRRGRGAPTASRSQLLGGIKRIRDELAKSPRERFACAQRIEIRESESALMKIIWRPLRETISRLVSAKRRDAGGLQTHCRSRSVKQ